MRWPQPSSNSVDDTRCDSVAENSLMGMFTSPKLIEPVQMGRAMSQTVTIAARPDRGARRFPRLSAGRHRRRERAAGVAALERELDEAGHEGARRQPRVL